MREDRQLLLLLHLSQLLNLISGIGGFVVPLVIWLTQKEHVQNMDRHGKMIINFQITMFICCLISVPLVFLFGLGIVLFIVIAVLTFVFPIINGIKASNGQEPHYPLSFEFLK